ncbi:MAG: hypothetical protein WC595_02495 [Candidatus Nanoarchaeia archaeon]
MAKSKKNNFKLVKIKKIEFTDEEVDMCDLEIPKFHNFVLANGIVTHNSANIDLNILRQADFLLLKPSSLLQKDFERKKINEIYKDAEKQFKQYKDQKGLTYIYSETYKGFVANPLPSFWNEKVSKSYR